MQRRIPITLLGKPVVYEAWLLLRAFPEIRPADLGRICSTRASDGSWIRRELKKAAPSMHKCVFSPTEIPIQQRYASLFYDLFHTIATDNDLPFKLTLSQIGAMAGCSPTKSIDATNLLIDLGLVEMEKKPSSGVRILKLSYLDDDPIPVDSDPYGDSAKAAYRQLLRESGLLV